MQRESDSGAGGGRHRFRGGLTLAVLLAASATSEPAAAVGLVSASHAPIEERLALSIGPERTTVWVQLRTDGATGPLAMIVAVEPGTVLDWAAPSWMEALELATAPRILPPVDVVPACPGDSPATDVVHLAGERYHHDALAPLELVELGDAGAVALWAAASELELGAELAGALAAMNSRFVAARFLAPEGPSRTPTLRLSGPGATAVLPLVLSRGRDEPLKVTSFTLAAGRTELLGGLLLQVDGADLSYEAQSGASDYPEVLLDLLEEGGPQAYALECASREALTGSLAVGSGGHLIAGATQTYLERAALYSGGAFELPSCLAQVEAALAKPWPVAASCARGSLGAVGGPVPCTEAVAAGQVDPAELRCTDDFDDLSVALSGQIAADVVLTRLSLLVPSHGFGQDRFVGVTSAPSVAPVWTAETLDLGDCAGGEGGSGGGPGSGFGGGMDGSGASSSGASSSGGSRRVPVYEVTGGTCGAGDVGSVLYYLEVDEDDTTEAYYQETDDCGGDTTTSYDPGDSGTDAANEGADVGSDAGSEDCGGDSPDSYDSSGDDCGGDSGDSYDGDDCGGDSGDGYDGGEDCGGDSPDSYDGDDCGGDSSGGESCDGGDVADSGGGCDGGDAGDCSMAERRGKRKIPRLSILVMAALALLTPLRRWTRPRRRLTA